MKKNMNQSEKINLLALGNAAVGKTSFILRYTEDCFREIYLTSLGMDFRTKTITLPNKKTYRIDIYDTAGQEKYRSISLNTIKYADGIILMYDITSSKSFEAIDGWLESIKMTKSENFPLILVGNKCDLEAQRIVLHEEGENLAKNYGIKFFEISNKTGININETVLELINKIIEQKENNKLEENDKIKLEIEKNRESKKKHCDCSHKADKKA